ncbi:MAG: septum formation initiator family protein [Lachnospiraceae bacterium]|nr:septum formation initiator family protein [Lachnospiraceae bacterium]
MAGRYRAGKKRQNRFSMVLAMLVVVLLLAVVAVSSMRLSSELKVKEKKRAELEQQIRDEIERSREIDEYEKYVQTDQYKERAARDKLGMVKDGETVFEDEGSR